MKNKKRLLGILFILTFSIWAHDSEALCRRQLEKQVERAAGLYIAGQLSDMGLVILLQGAEYDYQQCRVANLVGQL